MSPTEAVKELEVRVALHESDLLALLPKGEKRLRRRLEFFTSPESRKTDLVAHFSTSGDIFTLSGLLRGKWPVYFVLKPKTKTYTNFLRFLANELRTLSSPEHGGVFSSPVSESQAALMSLTAYVEKKLRLLDQEVQYAAEDVGEIVDVFKGDFEVLRRPVAGYPRADSARQKQRVFGRFRVPYKRKLRFIDGEDPKVISGFLILEIEGVAQQDVKPQKLTPEDAAAVLRSSLRFLSPPELKMAGRKMQVAQRFEIDPLLLAECEFGLHWGCYDGRPWADQDIPREDISPAEGRVFVIDTLIEPPMHGRYGVTIYAKHRVSKRRIWLGETFPGDVTVDVPPSALEDGEQIDRRQFTREVEIKGRILQSLSSFDNFVRVVYQLRREKKARGLGRTLYELTRGNTNLRKLVSEYLHQALEELGQQRRGLKQTRLRKLIPLLRNIGIGEVVLVSPEGPHAIAGGLAQVIVGLTNSFCECDIPATVITPLYEEAQGNKHKSAETILAEGVMINGKLTPLKELDWLSIPIGPRYEWGGSRLTANPQILRARVYLAEADGIRIFLLRHPQLADKLYANVWSDEQLRRAVFLCRGALELMRKERYEIDPQIVVTNDWMTGFVPVFLQTDPRYLQDSRLRQIETVHIIHNGGRDYQGRFETNFFGEDLYPMLGIGPEHFFGLRDPNDSKLLNVTAGAIFHVRKALLTVSKPYAEQLLKADGGEGLESLYRRRRQIVFGISNGIDLETLRRIFWELGEKARESLELPPLGSGKYHEKRLLKHLPLYKQSLKSVVQKKFGFEANPRAVLVSLISRLAEQKGIKLLTSTVPGGKTVLEAILESYREVQIFIGGPSSDGDPVVGKLREVVTALEGRFPGRIKAVFDFILHKEALEITQASDLFLMPSRYEPGGITQLEALAAGTLVIARNIGGISATVENFCGETGAGNGFLFEEYSGSALYDKISLAVKIMRDERLRNSLIHRAALSEHDWSHRAPKYVTLFQHISGVLEPHNTYPHLQREHSTLEAIRPE